MFPVCFLPKAVAVTIKYHCWEQRFFFEASIDSTHGFRLFPVVLLSENRCRNTIRHRWEKIHSFSGASVLSSHGNQFVSSHSYEECCCNDLNLRWGNIRYFLSRSEIISTWDSPKKRFQNLLRAWLFSRITALFLFLKPHRFPAFSKAAIGFLKIDHAIL